MLIKFKTQIDNQYYFFVGYASRTKLYPNFKSKKNYYFINNENKEYLIEDNGTVLFSKELDRFELVDAPVTIKDGKLVLKENKKMVLRFETFIRTLNLRKVANKNKRIRSKWLANRSERIIINEQEYIVNSVKEQAVYKPSSTDFELNNYVKNGGETAKIRCINVYICFDIETIKNEQGILEPYLIAAHAFYPEHDDEINSLGEGFESLKLEEVSKLFIRESLAENSIQICKEFVYFVNSFFNIHQGLIKEIIIFGYNNNRFDNFFVFDELKSAWKHAYISIDKRNGKTSGIKICLGGDKKIIITDLIKMIPDMSLNEACQEYGLPNKIDINIVAYNNASYDNKELLKECNFATAAKFIKNSQAATIRLKYKQYVAGTNFKIFKMICDYCIQDVRATVNLFRAIDKSVKDGIIELKNLYPFLKFRSHRFIDYRSPSHLVGDVYKSILNQKGEKHVKFLKKPYVDLIYSCYRGGCVFKGISGSLVDEHLRYLDFTALYPTICKNKLPSVKNYHDVLTGKEVPVVYLQTIIDKTIDSRAQSLNDKTLHTEEWCRYYRANFYYSYLLCDVYPPDDSTQLLVAAPIGTRLKNTQNIIYEHLEKKAYPLNSVDILSCIMQGYKITIIEYDYNVCFLESDFILSDLMENLNGLKKQAIAQENRALKKFWKLLMNSIVGKLSQKNESRIMKEIICNNMSSDISDYNEISMSNTYYLAAIVTSQARHALFWALYNVELPSIYKEIPLDKRIKCLYGDTDSFIFPHREDNLNHFIISDELAPFDEHLMRVFPYVKEKYQGFNFIIVISSKCYVLGKCDVNDFVNTAKIECLKLKGVHGQQTKQFTIKDLLNIFYQKKEISFVGLVRENNVDNPLSYMKYIVEKVIKKTVSKDKSNLLELDCNCEEFKKLNKFQLEKETADGVKGHLVWLMPKFKDVTKFPQTSEVTSICHSSFKELEDAIVDLANQSH